VSLRKAKTMLTASLTRTLELRLTVAHVNKYVNLSYDQQSLCICKYINTHMASFAVHSVLDRESKRAKLLDGFLIHVLMALVLNAC
jgi:hypothetical protein